MRILLISRCLPYPLHLGDRLILYHVARELSARGHEIDLIAFKDRPEDEHWDAAPVRRFFRSIETIDAVPNARAAFIQRTIFPSARFPRKASQSLSPQMWRAIEAKLAANDYDLAHVFGGVRVYEYFHPLRGLPAIITPYDSYSLYLKRLVESAHGRQLSLRLEWDITKRIERWMFEPYRCAVFVAEADAIYLKCLNPRLNTRVISNGIDLDYFRVQQVEREPATLLFTGNFEYVPNIDAAITLGSEILPKVQAQRPDARLLLVGNNPPPQMQALAANNPAITVTGYVDDLRPYLARGTAFVSALKIGAGIKNKVLEAMAMGLPVVATPLSVDGIAVQHEREVLVTDVENMADATLRLLGDAALRSQLAANGRALIESRYSWAHVAEQYERLYDAAING
jgi:polysaccharide biosynthesis protein PslH